MSREAEGKNPQGSRGKDGPELSPETLRPDRGSQADLLKATARDARWARRHESWAQFQAVGMRA